MPIATGFGWLWDAQILRIWLAMGAQILRIWLAMGAQILTHSSGFLGKLMEID